VHMMIHNAGDQIKLSQYPTDLIPKKILIHPWILKTATQTVLGSQVGDDRLAM